MEDRTVFQPSPVGSVRPGVRLNGIYEIVTFVTQGGMGEVYRGFNIQTGDPVAIKMIRPELTNNPDVLELFKREAKTLHQLAHEAIVRYFVFTVDPDTRRAYLAMEFVDGLSLTNRFESSPLPLTDVKILQTRIGSALEAAHRLGVIHRDISPDNIILPDGDVRNAKVIDFGIARSLKRTEATIIGGGFAGKYNYASPEQFGLAGGEVTFKSDIYSFGLVLAAALRGRPIDMGGSEVEAIAKRSVVPDLSDIDQAIRPLIRAMLQPLPADRPASMAAVAAWGSGEATSIAARRETPQTAGGRAAAILGSIDCARQRRRGGLCVPRRACSLDASSDGANGAVSAGQTAADRCAATHGPNPAPNRASRPNPAADPASRRGRGPSHDAGGIEGRAQADASALRAAHGSSTRAERGKPQRRRPTRQRRMSR